MKCRWKGIVENRIWASFANSWQTSPIFNIYTAIHIGFDSLEYMIRLIWLLSRRPNMCLGGISDVHIIHDDSLLFPWITLISIIPKKEKRRYNTAAIHTYIHSTIVPFRWRRVEYWWRGRTINLHIRAFNKSVHRL